MTTTLSVSLSEDDLAFMDELVTDGKASSRSDAIHMALRAFHESVIERALVAQFDSATAESANDVADWDAVAGDGL